MESPRAGQPAAEQQRTPADCAIAPIYRYASIPQRAASRSRRRTTLMMTRVTLPPALTEISSRGSALRARSAPLYAAFVSVQRCISRPKCVRHGAASVERAPADLPIAQSACSIGKCQYPNTPPHDRGDLRPLTARVRHDAGIFSPTKTTRSPPRGGLPRNGLSSWHPGRCCRDRTQNAPPRRPAQPRG
jgi:hypothetical protein